MLLRNSLWNISGFALPAIAALASVPMLIHALGAEGYGIVTIVGSIIGYFGVLDINLSAGAIKYLAESHAAGDRERFRETFWFGAFFYGFFGLAGALALFFGSDWLVTRLFDLTPASRHTAALALRIGAAGFAIAQLQNYLIIVPQSLQRYDRSAQTEAFFGILVNVATVAAALMGGGVPGVIATRIAVSALNGLYLIALVRRLRVDLRFRLPSKAVRRSMTSFSAYAYLSKIATTLYQHGDKLIVGAIAGPTALTYYSVPVTLANRILGLTFRMSSVIYPRASALAALSKMNELRSMYVGATRYIAYLNLIALGIVILAGDQFLRHWVGEAFVAQGYPVLVMMTTALLVDSLTNIPSLVNDALGHPRITGRFALSRGILGTVLVYIGAHSAGIIGAAAAHLMSACLLSALFLMFVHGRTVPVGFGESIRNGWGRSFAVGLLVFGVLLPLKWLLPSGLAGTIAIVTIAAFTLAVAGLIFIVDVDERAALFAAARRLRGSV